MPYLGTALTGRWRKDVKIRSSDPVDAPAPWLAASC
jgi:hypothetical protein